MKTREEVEKLKENWHNDPNWNIETTEGFEDYKDELRKFRRKSEREWKKQNQKHHDRLTSFTCPILSIGYSIGFGFDSRNQTNLVGCQAEKCAFWDSNFEKCLMILPAYFESCQKARSER